MVANEGTEVTFEKSSPMCTTQSMEQPEPPEQRSHPIKNGGVGKLNLDKKLHDPPNIYNTIMDVIVFLVVSAGHILQVSIFCFAHPVNFSRIFQIIEVLMINLE